MRACRANTTFSWLRSASTADCMSGYCSLAASAAPSCADRAVHLAQRGGGRRLRLEALEAGRPIRPQLRHHAPAHERRAHGRGLRLQLGQLLRVLGRQRLGDGGQQLRHLHDRPLEAAQRRRQRRRILAVVGIEAEQALARHPRRHRADVGADPHIARRPRREAVLFLSFLSFNGEPSWPLDTAAPRLHSLDVARGGIARVGRPRARDKQYRVADPSRPVGLMHEAPKRAAMALPSRPAMFGVNH